MSVRQGLQMLVALLTKPTSLLPHVERPGLLWGADRQGARELRGSA
jgi:hypothetical protein